MSKDSIEDFQMHKKTIHFPEIEKEKKQACRKYS